MEGFVWAVAVWVKPHVALVAATVWLVGAVWAWANGSGVRAILVDALEPFEGWDFTLRIEDTDVVDPSGDAGSWADSLTSWEREAPVAFDDQTDSGYSEDLDDEEFLDAWDKAEAGAVDLLRKALAPLIDEDRPRGALAAAADRVGEITAMLQARQRQDHFHLVRHPDGRVLVIGQYLDQLAELARHVHAPLITGKTPNAERERLYERFRRGDERILIVSKVGNFAIDLPDANVAIQISGTFGSRQEEAQRLGRILRPKSNGSAASFYAVVTLGSRDQEFAQKRQLFLTEQGYRYEILYDHELADLAPVAPAGNGTA